MTAGKNKTTKGKTKDIDESESESYKKEVYDEVFYRYKKQKLIK